MAPWNQWNDRGHHRWCGYISAGVAAAGLLLTLVPSTAAHGAAAIAAAVFSCAVILWVDFYAIRLIYACAYKGDHSEEKEERWPGLPYHLPALVVVPLVFFALVCAFAALYSISGQIHNTSGSLTGLVSPLYFSLVTITTLGYGDFAPTGLVGQLIVMGQLLSGFIFLLMAFPVLASRLASWDKYAPATKITIKKTADGIQIGGVEASPSQVSSSATIEVAGPKFTAKDGNKIT